MIGDFSYGFGRLLKGAAFDDAVTRVIGALGQEEFGVLTELDVQETLKRKRCVEFRRYVILGACNPRLAHQALESDPHIGLLLPCNVVVQEMSGGDLGVSAASPQGMFRLTGNPQLKGIAEEAEVRLRRAIESLY